MDQLAETTARVMARLRQEQNLPARAIVVADPAQCPVRTLPRRCEVCEDFSRAEGGQRVTYQVTECRDKQARRRMIAKSGLYGKDIAETFAAATIDRYNADLYRYLQSEWDRKKWLYIWSPGNGTGKSYTANAIANMLIGAGVQPLVSREIDMAAKLQATFDDDAGGTEYALMGRFKAVPVLIIQDMGKQGAKSEWWPQKLYDIIDHRVIEGKTMVFTSNYNLEDERAFARRFGENHGPAIYSRLMGMCDIWHVDGPDRRQG